MIKFVRISAAIIMGGFGINAGLVALSVIFMSPDTRLPPVEASNQYFSTLNSEIIIPFFVSVAVIILAWFFWDWASRAEMLTR